MKCISLHNPYATGMALGLKTIETRGWYTKHRGDLLIQAAQKKDNEVTRNWLTCMTHLPSLDVFRSHGIISRENMDYGAILCRVNLVNVIPTCEFYRDTERKMINLLGKEQWDIEKHWGNFGPGRFLWMTEEMFRLPDPVFVRGYQQLFEVEGVL